jgi:hypothetical protein
MLKDLIKLADTLDKTGLSKEANIIDNIIKKVSSEDPSDVETLEALEEPVQSSPMSDSSSGQLESKLSTIIHKIVLAIRDTDQYIRVIETGEQGSVPIININELLRFFRAIQGGYGNTSKEAVGTLMNIRYALKMALKGCLDPNKFTTLSDAMLYLGNVRDYVNLMRDKYWAKADADGDGWEGVHPFAGELKHFSYGVFTAKLELEKVIELMRSGESVSSEKAKELREYNSKYLD